MITFGLAAKIELAINQTEASKTESRVNRILMNFQAEY